MKQQCFHAEKLHLDDLITSIDSNKLIIQQTFFVLAMLSILFHFENEQTD